MINYYLIKFRSKVDIHTPQFAQELNDHKRENNFYEKESFPSNAYSTSYAIQNRDRTRRHQPEIPRKRSLERQAGFEEDFNSLNNSGNNKSSAQSFPQSEQSNHAQEFKRTFPEPSANNHQFSDNTQLFDKYYETVTDAPRQDSYESYTTSIGTEPELTEDWNNRNNMGNNKRDSNYFYSNTDQDNVSWIFDQDKGWIPSYGSGQIIENQNATSNAYISHSSLPSSHAPLPLTYPISASTSTSAPIAAPVASLVTASVSPTAPVSVPASTSNSNTNFSIIKTMPNSMVNTMANKVSNLLGNVTNKAATSATQTVNKLTESMSGVVLNLTENRPSQITNGEERHNLSLNEHNYPQNNQGIPIIEGRSDWVNDKTESIVGPKFEQNDSSSQIPDYYHKNDKDIIPSHNTHQFISESKLGHETSHFHQNGEKENQNIEHSPNYEEEKSVDGISRNEIDQSCALNETSNSNNQQPPSALKSETKISEPKTVTFSDQIKEDSYKFVNDEKENHTELIGEQNSGSDEKVIQKNQDESTSIVKYENKSDEFSEKVEPSAPEQNEDEEFTKPRKLWLTAFTKIVTEMNEVSKFIFINLTIFAFVN